MRVKYLYRATFTDGTKFEQPADDESRLRPGEKSSFFDFLEYSKGRTLETFTLMGGGHAYTLDHRSGHFALDGRVVCKPGYPLPEGLAWVEGNPHIPIYFRLVTKSFDAELEELGTQTLFCFGVKHEPGVKNFLAVS